ncbi:MAG: sigma-70 family RNA polymerase sigma factor [Lentisphaeraceae bacterium]|nr:sigma-70 family RNA polymerase sigma factor [Lentisphaeraceae bacterium]
MKEIIKRVLAGEKNLFRELVHAYSPTMRVYLSTRLSDRQTVDDLMQEIFVAIYWNLKTYDGKSDPQLWVRAVTRNKLMSYLRTQYSQKNSVNVMKVNIEGALLDELDTMNDNQQEVMERLSSCIKKQKEHNQELIEARYFTKESVIAMAQRLKTTVSSISSELYRVRKQLKQCIEQEVEL